MNTQRVEGHTPTLKECPFCGGEAAPNKVTYSEKTIDEQGWEQDTFFGVNCIHCGADNKGLRGFDTQEKAKEFWNRRASIERLEKVNEALVRALELLYLDVLQGADPASKECQERTGSFAKAAEAIRLAKEPA